MPRRQSGDQGPQVEAITTRPTSRLPIYARACVGSLCLLALVAGFGLLTVPVVLHLAGRFIPAKTVLRRLFLGILALFGLNAAVLTVAAVLQVPVDARVLVAMYLGVGGIALSAPAFTSPSRRFADSSDWWALGSALIVFALFYRPFIGASLGRGMALLSYSTDGGNHLSLVLRGLQQGGYVAQSDYPPAWAGNMALLVELGVAHTPTPAEFISMVAPVIVASYALMTFFAVALVLDVISTVVGVYRQYSAAIAAGCVVLCALVGSWTLLPRSGSYTQITAITILLAVTSMLVTSGGAHVIRLSIVLGLLTVGLMQTWYLLAPVLAVLLLSYLVNIRPPRLKVLLVAGPTALLCSYPLAKGPPPVVQLNTPGGALLPPLPVVLLLLLLVLCSILLLLRKSAHSSSSPVVLCCLVVSTLILTVAVISIQQVTGNGLGYYGAKLLYVVLLLGAVAGAVAAGIYGERTLSKPGHPGSWLFGTLVVLLIVGGLAGAAAASRSDNWPYVAGQAPTALDGAVLDAIFSAHPMGLTAETDVWVLDGCTRLADHIANKWLHDLFDTWTDSRRATNNLYRGGRAGDVSMLLKRTEEVGLQRMEVYVHDLCNSDGLAQLAGSSKVTVVRVP